ncbi:MAG: ATP-binding cassette domain-containing protein [Neomegalonema sp.]|nr:ATP-binding cassette domain-containing protein [Neomegalonema sp.]
MAAGVRKNTPAILNCDGLALGYPAHELAHGLQFHVQPGDVLAVVGHNGSGKTTFVKTVLGMRPPLAGTLSWPRGRPREIGYLAQLSEFDRRFPIKTRDLAAMGAWRGFGFRGRVDEATRARITMALEATGVAEVADQPIYTLSGGQLQRALFSRVIVQDAPLILLDEPFAAVDQRTEAQLLDVIDQWSAEGRGVILVVHDLSAVLDRCSHALLLGGGRGVYGAVDEVLTVQNLVAQGYMSESQAAWAPRIYRGTELEAGHG